MQKHHELLLVFKAHLGEYVHKPLMNIGFIISLAIATSTLLCILVLNHASKQQYQEANSRLKSPVSFYILAKQGQHISLHDFRQLKQQGFHQLSPIHVFRKTLSTGQKITFRALDILPLILTRPESFSSHTININHKYANNLALIKNDETLESSTHNAMPNTKLNVEFANNVSSTIKLNNVTDWGDVALLDLTLAWQLFPDIRGYSHLISTALPAHEMTRLAAALPDYLYIQQAYSLEERAGFADALHLNLTALAILGFIVSLFIAYQGANQAWRKRAELAAKLRLLGVELTTILQVMLCESLILTLLASIIGIAIAGALVSILLPVLGITLDQLYQLRLSGHFQWHWHYSLWAFAISFVAVFTALIKQFMRIKSAKIAFSARQPRLRFNFNQSLLVSLALLCVYLFWPENYTRGSWTQLMLKNGSLLLASVAILPNLLRSIFSLLSKVSHSFRLKYLLQDASEQVGLRYLPLAAFYLALTASISAALMVNSFESSFVRYLNQLLSADFFIRYNDEQKPTVESWLKAQPDIKAYALFEETIAKHKADTVKIYALHSISQQNSLLFKAQIASSLNQITPKPLDSPDNKQESYCYINEQLSLKRGYSLQEKITIKQANHTLQCLIQGIYYDYGNQGFAVKFPINSSNKMLYKSLDGWKEQGFGVHVKPSSTLTKARIAQALSLDEEQIYQPAQIKQLALGIFKQTFVLTQAIAFVLLTIACFGLFLSANSLELARKSDLHTLSSLGYSQLGLFSHMLGQWLCLAIGAVLLSWPIATLLANALVGEVLPASFGWSMPLTLNIGPFAVSSLIGLIILIPALTIPLYKLNVRANLS